MPILYIPINKNPEIANELPYNIMVGVFRSSGILTSVYLYLGTISFENVRIGEGRYAELFGEFTPGILLKNISKCTDNL